MYNLIHEKHSFFSLHNEKLTYLFQYSQLISTKRAILFELLFFKTSISMVNEIISTIQQEISTYRQITTNSHRIIPYFITLFSKL
ncbi:hypothetical protein COJ07_09225 [Bacillus cereus]|uniref:Uncharacterized protein n=1 Tax=Bacillus cereus TaxID=1396 RepID=A0A2B0U540_BACCE|nr:hypothetical protein COJ07_09225 [Bacillus cereus]PFU43239.1 hypothetical protein COK86_11800 [Bacillus cereus]